MKRKLDNSSGSGAIEVLIVIVILAIVGGIGWYVMQSSNKDNRTAENNQTISEDSQDETKDWKSFSRYGITFKYPPDWNFESQDTVQSSGTFISSRDFGGLTEEEATGALVTVNETWYREANLTAENFKTVHLDNNPNPHDYYQLITVNGAKAVQYSHTMSDALTTVFFVAGGKTVTFNFDDYSSTPELKNIYDKIVGSVLIN